LYSSSRHDGREGILQQSSNGAEPKRLKQKSAAPQGRENTACLFMIGMRINRFWKVQKWLPVAMAMPLPGQAARRKHGFGRGEWSPPDSRIRDLGPELVSAGPQEYGASQHPVADAAETAWFRHDLLTSFDLLQQKKIKPLIAERLPLYQARHAHELLGSGGVIGKIVLMPNGQQKRLSYFSAKEGVD
jgi:hypothetical protein